MSEEKKIYSKEEIEGLKSRFPSVCYSCDFSRRPASNSNIEKGYVGCCIRVLNLPNRDFEEITDAEEIGEGWVDLKSRIGRASSGMITNFQLLTKGVKSCNFYKNLDE